MSESVTRSEAATEDVRLPYTDETPVTLGMLLAIARSAHRDRHMPEPPPSLAVAYVDAIENLLPNRWRGG
jgi:hypothetical protein